MLPENPEKSVESLVNTLYPGMLGKHVSLLPQKEGDVPELVPPHLTIRSLFKNYLELSSKPQRRFVECLESSIDETDSTMRDTLANTRSFFYWASDKTYFSTLLQYKAVAPTIETLVSSVPFMRPRIYTPIYNEGHRANKKVGICVKLVPGGLCSNYLCGLKKGSKVMVKLAPSTLARPNEAFMSEFADLKGKNAAEKGADSVSIVTVKSSFNEARMGVHRLPLESFPLAVSVTELFAKQISVDEPETQEFFISNPSKEKVEYMLTPVKTEKYVVDFDISFGVIKPKYSVPVKATLTALCTKSTVISISLSCKGVGSK